MSPLSFLTVNHADQSKSMGPEPRQFRTKVLMSIAFLSLFLAFLPSFQNNLRGMRWFRNIFRMAWADARLPWILGSAGTALRRCLHIRKNPIIRRQHPEVKPFTAQMAPKQRQTAKCISERLWHECGLDVDHDEPEILRRAINSICSTSADGLKIVVQKPPPQ